MASIELDVCSDGEATPEDAARLLGHQHGLVVHVVVEDGPGGGWPVCRFTGERKDIAEMLMVYCDGDVEEATFLAEDIKE